MIIKKIEIQNFRSYYKENKFEFTKGFNLIIGTNGGGKTTFYKALEWLFRTDGMHKMDIDLISKKRIHELAPNESDNVRLAMSYEHKGSAKLLEKTFLFTKSSDGIIKTSNYSFSLFEDIGSERTLKVGEDFDNDLSSEIRKYLMFEGEAKLDVLQTSNAMKLLIDNFGDVKDFDAYSNFMEYATGQADSARDNAQKLNRRNEGRVKQLTSTIERETGILSEIEKELKDKSEEAANFKDLLKNIERSKEASNMLVSVNRRIESLTQKRAEIAARIKEDYTINLLDDMWILMGFGDVAEEYSSKINAVDLQRRKLEKDYLLNAGAEKVIKKMNTDFIPLPVHIPGQKIMEEMLEEEVCKICGRPAKKNSEPWNYMLQRLDEYKQSLSADKDEEIEPYYKNNYVVELQKRDTTLNDNLAEITKMRHAILDAIAFNKRLHDDINKIEANLHKEYDQKKRILAQTDGLTEEELMNNYERITGWMEKQNKAENRVDVLKKQKELHRKTLEDAQTELSNISEGTPAAMSAKTALILRHIADAFKDAKEENKSRLLTAIEDEANTFMERLNINDFTGTIRIIEKQDGQGEIFLMDYDETRILNPNEALKTTYLMSVLFAINKLSGEKDNTELPLIFDAPTSSFMETKENEFFNVISRLGKQVIVSTKKFLKDIGKQEPILDINKVKDINGRVFFIKKKEPYNKKDERTIQTVIEKIK